MSSGQAALLVAAQLVAALLVACPAARGPGPSQLEEGRPRSGDREPEARPATGLDWRPADGGQILYREVDLLFELPQGWLVRPGEGTGAWEAKGPRWPAALLRIGPWDGSIEGMIDRYEAVDQGWLSSGPYANLEALDGRPPLVGTWRGEEDVLVVGWYFRVDGTGVALVAELPAPLFEESWRDVDHVVRSTRRRTD